MKRGITLPIAATLALFFVGCAGQTYQGKVADIRQAYVIALNAASDERAAGNISDAKYVQFEKIRATADAFISALEVTAATQPSDGTPPPGALDVAYNLLTAMQAALQGSK